ncbi:MAG TPA: fused MFS/spermidine synthase [Rhizomicrobium sp.]|jgi:SAM-dependent methyltransferase|nr:fused MFS/spermidine synthase [Rhizomicrobium sp.]
MKTAIPAPGHVIRRSGGKIAYWQRQYQQSASDSTGVSLADYIHAFYFFLMQAGVRDVLMIGCGGGNLATMLWRSGVDVTVVDIEPRSFAIARKYFAMPADIPCHVADGIAWLKAHRRRHGAIVLDAFGPNGMPEVFMADGFFRLAKSRMRPRGGLFLMNVIVDDDEDRTPDRLVRLMRRHWRGVKLLDTDGWVDRNAVIAAGAVRGLKRPVILMEPSVGVRKLARQMDILDFRKIRG